ncbi:DNA-binding transcriptional MocR family regulator [Nocardioides luteus]|uniref:Aminotransferase n=1 Tax=Nocardioides luteus TaxID=1844 RepID=A0ABQ5T1W8_9ACTN|nr:aminotransferase class I/II-fold pyridoxal phosphate-dependent enzyme [Nocardioides luteus]MDR7313520.1 DNA-binding transcriptional MocR family regulator [Nocardioides luteus]GGR73369.1 putative aminotransferase [Nocardioides luteus]GLJ70061.1 putative aminotransferase [Nocardioides luteus]
MTSDPRPLAELSREELEAFATEQRTAYDGLVAQGLKLDLTRGKPSADQLNLSDGLLQLPKSTTAPDGTDTRNYGGLAGGIEIREIYAELLGLETDQLIAGGNSSLTMMRDTLMYLWLHGGVDSERPWGREETVKFVCPVPGYDRHFTLLEWFGIEMVTVPMGPDGPDADAVAALVADDPAIKGMWLVPTYANPTGDTTSQEIAERLASMPTAAPDFKIFWDNAYALHHLTPAETKTADVLSLANAAGHPHRPLIFASTSKVTYAGAGVGFFGGSKENVAWWLGHLSHGAIGPDKVNHLRHAEFFGSAAGVRDHMAKHRELLAPRFAAVEDALAAELGSLGVATWTKPAGGYFVSLDVLPGTASRVIELAKGAGVALTPAGSAFPGKVDPEDTNIRLAPSFPPLEQVSGAMEVVTVCVKLAAAEKLLA